MSAQYTNHHAKAKVSVSVDGISNAEYLLACLRKGARLTVGHRVFSMPLPGQLRVTILSSSGSSWELPFDFPLRDFYRIVAEIPEANLLPLGIHLISINKGDLPCPSNP